MRVDSLCYQRLSQIPKPLIQQIFTEHLIHTRNYSRGRTLLHPRDY